MEQFLGDSVMSDVLSFVLDFGWLKCRDAAEFFLFIDSGTFPQIPVAVISCGKSSHV